jgi:putative ABC transport system ATP-binding protein
MDTTIMDTTMPETDMPDITKPASTKMIIRLKEIYKNYMISALSIEVLKNINLDVKQGEFVAIMGASGSGKSTLLNIIGCLDRPTSGTFLLDDIDVNARTKDELAAIRNKKMGFVFQHFNLLPRIAAWKNVELPLLYSKTPPKERKERALEILDRVGLSHRAGHSPNELSGGEQQRVAIARALVNRPGVILADEPTGNLDSRSGGEITDLFHKLHAEGITIVMVTHNEELAESAQRVIVIKDGMCQSGCN